MRKLEKLYGEGKMNDLFAFSYDSPIERLVGEQMEKFVDYDIAKITPQYEIQTSGGFFILDFLIEVDGIKYAIECDGKEFHEYFADLYRDAWLLGEKHIDEMIRFRGQDIVSYPNLCMLYLFYSIRNLFYERYENVFEMEARNERWLKHQDTDPEGEHFYDEIDWQKSNNCEDVVITCGFDALITHRHKKTDVILQDWQKAFNIIQTKGMKSKQDFCDFMHKNDILKKRHFLRYN